MLCCGMTCSIDLRERVSSYVEAGGSKAEAARRYNVSRQTVYNWLGRDSLAPKAHGPRKRKLDKEALVLHVKEHPDALLRERAAHFGVHVNAVWVAMRGEGFVKKTA